MSRQRWMVTAREAGFLAAGFALGHERVRRLIARFGYRAVLALIFALAYSYAWLRQNPAAAALVVAAMTGAVLLMVMPRVWEWRARNAPVVRRTKGPAWWVYRIYEYRDREGRLVPLFLVGTTETVRHLVYIGKTSDFDQRMGQHRAEQPWWHDELEFLLPGQYFSEGAALKEEDRQIARAAAACRLEDRPRENKALNPSYDARRSARMRELAAATA